MNKSKTPFILLSCICFSFFLNSIPVHAADVCTLKDWIYDEFNPNTDRWEEYQYFSRFVWYDRVAEVETTETGSTKASACEKMGTAIRKKLNEEIKSLSDFCRDYEFGLPMSGRNSTRMNDGPEYFPDEIAGTFRCDDSCSEDTNAPQGSRWSCDADAMEMFYCCYPSFRFPVNDFQLSGGDA